MRELSFNEVNCVHGGIVIEMLCGLITGFGTGLGIAGLFLAGQPEMQALVIIGSGVVGSAIAFL